MKTNQRFLSMLLMAVVMIVMCPMMVWADDVTITTLSGSPNSEKEGYGKLFDGDFDSKWCGRIIDDYDDINCYVIFKLSESKAMTSYTLVDALDTYEYYGRHWKYWTIYGANFTSDEAATTDAIGWSIVDRQEDQEYNDESEATLFTVSNSTAYKYYMIQVDGVGESQGDFEEYNMQQMAEMLFTWDNPVPTTTLDKTALMNALADIEEARVSYEETYTITFANSYSGSDEGISVGTNIKLYGGENSDYNYVIAPTQANDVIMAPTDCNDLFARLSNLTAIDFTNFNTSNVMYMERMFSMWFEGNVNSNLGSITLGENFNTSNVKTMEEMFRGCKELTSLDLSCFNTSNVGTMVCIFSDCTKLTSLTIGNFDMSNNPMTYYMFADCPNLTTLTMKALPDLADETFNTQFSGEGKTVNVVLDDNSVVYTGATNYLPAATSATYTREMSNEWGTIVVPFSITYDADNGNYKLYKLTEADVPVNDGDDTGTLTIAEYEDEDEIEAGTPMVIKAVGTKTDGKYTVTLTANGNAISTAINSYKVTEGNVIMNGTYAQTTIGGVAGTWEYFIAENAFWWAEVEATVAPFRAWFTLDFGVDEGEDDLAPARFTIVEDETEGIQLIDSKEGTLYIVNGKCLDLQGRQTVEHKGLQIRDGRVIMVK